MSVGLPKPPQKKPGISKPGFPRPARPGESRPLVDPLRDRPRPPKVPKPRPNNDIFRKPPKVGGVRRGSPGIGNRVRRPRIQPRPTRRVYPRVGDRFKPSRLPTLSPKNVPTPSSKPSPRGAHALLFAQIVEAALTGFQELIAGRAIAAFDLNDGNTRTNRDSPCRQKLQPPCYGFGSWSGKDVNEFLEAAKERLEEFELQFAFSVLSSRVFMRIHNRMMDYAFDQLIAIIEKNSHGRPEPDKNVARRTVIRTVDVCVKKERLPKGSINK